MKTIPSIAILVRASLLALVLVALPQTGQAEDLVLINRPVNAQGLTGLLFTTAPYTIPKGTIETAFSTITENSVTPDYRVTEYPLSVTYGLANNSEIALRTSYYSIQAGPTTTTLPYTHKTGDVYLAYKWNFSLPQEGANMPAFAVMVSCNIPTEDKMPVDANAATHWGVKIGLSAGYEVAWKDHALGVYADGHFIGQDPLDRRLRDQYWDLNAGVLFPISKYQNLQMFMEYSMIGSKNRMTLTGTDYSGFTYGLRLVGEQFNLTFGTQFIRKSAEGFDNSEKVIALTSMKF